MLRRRTPELEVFLVHPGGPFWQRKDMGAWSTPKGEVSAGEDFLAAARREFEEETGIMEESLFLSLGDIRQSGGKIVTAWAFERDCSPAIRRNTFCIEWPPRSGTLQEFPEVDRGDWFSLTEARSHMLSGQTKFLDRLVSQLQ